jgi:predicted metal-dependent phosphoesterase TrpH
MGRRYDLHMHTRWSDGLATPEQAVARAREQGIAVGITDHNAIEGALRAWSLAGEDARDLVVPGIEVTTEERIHLLIWFRDPHDLLAFFERHISPFRPRGATATTPVQRKVGDLLQDLRAWDHLTAAAHPFAIAKNGWMTVRDKYAHIGPMLGWLDAVEVLNGQELDAGNAAAAAFAEQGGLGRVVGSDAHTVREIGKVALEIGDGDDLFEVVRAGAGQLIDKRPEATWRKLSGHGAKAAYYAQKPGRMAYRWAARVSGDGPETLGAFATRPVSGRPALPGAPRKALPPSPDLD